MGPWRLSGTSDSGWILVGDERRTVEIERLVRGGRSNEVKPRRPVLGGLKEAMR